jgi:drug/metabolite transporter (DMT)-like permease
VKKATLVAMLLLATAIWGWSFVVVKEAVLAYGVIAFLGLRFAIGSAVLGTLAIGHLNRRSILVGAGIGIALAGGYYCQTLGLRYTTVTNSGFITSLFVVTMPIINRLLFGVKIRPMFWAAVAISLAGLYLLTTATRPPQTAGVPPTESSKSNDSRSAGVSPATGDTPNASATEDAGETPALRAKTPALRIGNWSQATGDLLTLAAALLYGLHIALLDRFAKGHLPLTLAFGQTSCTAILFFLALLFVPLGEPLTWPSADVWCALAITGVLATALAFAIQTYVQQRLSAIASTLILTAEPVFATVSGCLLLGERLGGVQMLGVLLMICAILAAQIGAGEHASTYPLDPL